MNRERVIMALHRGMARGVTEFHDWTGGEYLADWGVESVLTAACARSLAEMGAEVSSPKALTIEQTLQGILDYSMRRGRPGHPTAAAKRIAEKSTGRVDIVLWNRESTPRAIIEIKRTAAVGGLLSDAERVIDFVKHAGESYGGSVRYGLLATVVSGAASRGEEGVRALGAKRRDALARAADKAGLAFRCHGPQWLDEAKVGRDHLGASYVFEFRAHPD